MAFFSARMNARQLVGFCRRLSTSLEAGIDVRTAWSREAGRAGGAMRRHLQTVSNGIDHGDSLADALAHTDDFFPVLFREMVGLGEESGHLDLVLARLADHYQNQIDMRRAFLASILWPIVQLAIAITVVGGLIWFTAVLRDLTNNPNLDLLGLGLVGTPGLTVYLAIVGGAFVAFALLVRAMNRGTIWVQPIQLLVLQLPLIGKPLQTLALSRLAWSLHITLFAGMDLRRALKLSLRSTHNARYTGQIPAIDSEIVQGNTIYQAFCRAGGYPVEFLDTIAVGEDSGRLVESLAILARQYHERARAAVAVLTMAGGWLVWAGVAAIIITIVVRLFSFYIGILNDAANM